MPIAPAFSSDELSFEIVENYWMALLLDLPFSQYETSALATQAALELSNFRNAAINERQAAGLPDEELALADSAGNITPETLFRAGCRRRSRPLSFTISDSSGSFWRPGISSTKQNVAGRTGFYDPVAGMAGRAERSAS